MVLWSITDIEAQVYTHVLIVQTSVSEVHHKYTCMFVCMIIYTTTHTCHTVTYNICIVLVNSLL